MSSRRRCWQVTAFVLMLTLCSSEHVFAQSTGTLWDSVSDPDGDAEVLFRATFWQRYKNRILAAAGLVTLQASLIATLLLERRRRRRAHVGLRESEERYRNVVDTQSELICRFLPDTTLTFVNDAYCKYFAKAPEELIGTKFVLLLPEPTRDPMLHYVNSLVAQPRRDTREHPVIRGGAISSWQQWTTSVISGAGARVELQGVCRDISERKRLEQQLMISERELSNLIENSPDVICRLNAELRYVYVSPNLDGVFGCAPDVFLGKQPGEIAIPDYNSSAFEFKCREAIQKKQATAHEFQYRGRHYRTRIIPEHSSGGAVESVISITEDFTDRLRAELELRRLTARLINLQDEERRRIARELHDGAAQNIAAMSLNLLRLKRMTTDESGEIPKLIDDSQQLVSQSLTELRTLSYLLHPPILDHAGLARAVQEFARGFSERSGIQVDSSGVQDIGRLPTDIETALFRVVQESLTNVRRHSGSETASIRLQRVKSAVKLQISDSGHGMLQSNNEMPCDTAVLGVGISGMRERLIQLGGRLEIESSHTGTTIMAVAPALQRAAAN